MKRILAVLAAVLLLAACHSSDPIVTASGATVHWRSTTSGSAVRHIEVIVPAKYATSSTMQAVNVAVQQANRSPYIRLAIHVPQVVPTTCTACILVTRGPLAYPTVARSYKGWGPDGHMYAMADRVVIDNSRPHPQQVLNNAGCHEIAGHGLGLTHSWDGTPGPCSGAQLTTHDLGLINQAHRHADRLN